MRKLMILVTLALLFIMLSAVSAQALSPPWNLRTYAGGYISLPIYIPPTQLPNPGWVNNHYYGQSETIKCGADKEEDTELHVVIAKESQPFTYNTYWKSDQGYEDGFSWAVVSIAQFEDGKYKWRMMTRRIGWIWDDYSYWVDCGGTEAWDVGIDLGNPQFVAISSSTHPENWCNKAAAAVSFYAYDPYRNGFRSGLHGYAYNVTANSPGSAPGTVNNTSGTVNYTFTSSGTYYVNARALDYAGNSSSSISRVMKVDLNNPSASTMSSLADGSYVKGTVALSGTASDSHSGLDKVELWDGNSLLASFNSSPYAYNWVTTGTANGAHTIIAKTIDKAGNSVSPSKVFNVDNYRPRTYASRAKRKVRRGSRVRLYWRVADPYTGGKGYVTLYLQKRYGRRYVTVKTIKYGLTKVNTSGYRYTSQKIRKGGTYRYLVKAKDQVKNLQHNTAVSGAIIVK